MSFFVDTIDGLLKEKGISRNKMLTDLHLNKNSMVDWNKRGTIPKANVVSEIAEYLGVQITELLEGSDNPETFAKFSEKLLFAMKTAGIDVSELSCKLDLPKETINGWLNDENDQSYVNYFEQLSSIFDVLPKYWFIPGAIPPGIEPTTDEYMLIILYREYQKTGKIDADMYGSLEHYFPLAVNHDCITSKERELLNLFHQLPHDAQIEFKGEIKGYLKALQKTNTSVAAEEPMRKAAGK